MQVAVGHSLSYVFAVGMAGVFKVASFLVVCVNASYSLLLPWETTTLATTAKGYRFGNRISRGAANGQAGSVHPLWSSLQSPGEDEAVVQTPKLPLQTVGSTHLDPLWGEVASSSISDNNNNRSPKKKDLRQFSRYLEVECWKRAELRSLEPVLYSVANACKEINRIVQRAQTDDIYGAAAVAVDVNGSVGGITTTTTTNTNIQGEVQQKLDVLCNAYLLRAFCGSSRVIHSVASEEEDEPRCCSVVMVSFSLFF